ncbi:MAG: PEP-CTERM system TPR-repeat protein PrsT [Gammaproteobacteria bacterium]|nr:MAG: PEP-CTERM system TPR-repeat protein PrsT [Gammaproteobacteria bacterium]
MKTIFISLFLVTILSACSDQSAEEFLTKAKTAIANGNNDAAIIELKNAIRKKPTVAEARFLLGKLYLGQRQYELAEKELNKALNLNYSPHEILPLLSKSYNKTGAIVALTKLKYKQRGLTTAQAAEVAYYKLKALIKLKQKIKAQAIADEIRAIKTNSPFKSLSHVLSLVNANKLSLATQQLDIVLSKYKKNAEALKLKADLLLQSNKPKKALAILRRYYEEYPEDEDNSFRLAHLLITQEQSKEAEPIVDTLMEKFTNSALLYQLKAIARFDVKDYKQALHYSEKAIRQLPEESQLRLIAGYSAYFLNDYEKANQHLSFLVTKLPATHPALRLLAASQLALGLGIEASNTLNSIEDIDEHDAMLFSSAGLTLSQQGETVKAKQLLAKAKTISHSPLDMAQLGLLKLNLNDRSGITNIETALNDQQVAQNIQYKNTLATAYLSTKQYKKAIQLAKKWQQQDDQDILAYLLKATVFKQQQKYDLAINTYQAAIAIKPKSLQLKLLLADTKYMQGDKTAADEIYRSLIEKKALLLPAWQRIYRIAKENQQTSTVKKQLEQVVSEHPENQPLQFLLARLYLNDSDFSNALNLLAPFEAKSFTEIPKEFWPLMAEVYIKQQQRKKAYQHYKKWLEAEPKSRAATLGSIIMMDSIGKHQPALKLVNSYLNRVGDDDTIELFKSHLLVMLQQFSEAQKIFNNLPNNLQQTPAGNEVAGQIALHNKNLPKALEKLSLAYAKQPNPRVTRLIAMIHFISGNKEKSFNFLQQHTKKFPNDTASWLLFANQQIQQAPNSSVPSYEHVLTLQPENLVALNNLAYLYFQQGKLIKAQKKANIALKLQPDNIYILDTAAQIYLAQNQNQKALDLLSKAVSNRKVDDEVYVDYIHALLATNQKILAKRKIKDRTISSSTSQQKLDKIKRKYGIN